MAKKVVPIKKKTAKKAVLPPKPLPQRTKTAKAAKPVPVEPQVEVVAPEPVVEKLTKKERKAQQAEAEQKAAEASDAPHIEARLYVGEMSVLVDATSLAHTIGAGQWGHGDGLVDKWPDTVWTGLLAHLGLPAFPLDRAVAEKPVKRLVQRLWYEAIEGRVPEERAAVFAQRDAESAETYKKVLPQVVQEAKAKGERAKKSFSKGRGGTTTYVPTDKLKKAEVKGQAAVLLAFFKSNKWGPATTATAAEGMVSEGLVTSTKPERIAAFYLCQWVKSGLLTKSVVE